MYYPSMLYLLGGTPEVTPIEDVACIPKGDCRQEIFKPDYQINLHKALLSPWLDV